MIELTKLPNIGKTLALKLESVGILNEFDLKDCGSENVIIKIASLQNGGVCINMLYALEGAIQGIRWHQLSPERKAELKAFYQVIGR